jgi:hypothetical protein
MSDYSDEKHKQEMNEQKNTLAAKKAANNSHVEFIIDPPGILEPTTDRRRQGIQRIQWRSLYKPNVHTFITMPMMNADAVWDGATYKDSTKATFEKRMDWEKNAPRFLVQQPPAGVDGDGEQWVSSLGMMDFWYDKGMYGKVDRSQMPIYLSEAYQLPVHDGDYKISAPSFVSQAWRHFEKDWVEFWHRNTRAGPENSFGKTDGVLYPGGVYRPQDNGLMKLHSGWQSMHPLYNDYMRETFSNFQQWLLLENRTRKILTFRDFVRSLAYYLDAFAPNQFLTRSAFILSRKCPRACSGFEIQIGEGGDPNDDILKKKKWLSDPNFEVWVAKLGQFGFRVDFNCPWRVIADVNSEPMRKFIRDYAVEGQWGSGKQSLSVVTLQNKSKELKAMAGSVQPHPNSETESSRLLKKAASMDAAALRAQTHNLDDMFKTCYYRADHTDMLTLMNYILSWWNDYARAFPILRTAIFRENKKGPADGTVTVEHARYAIPYDGAANPSIENLKNPYSLMSGKSIYRRAGDKATEFLKKSSWDIWVNMFGSDFPAKFYFFVRAREAAVTWDQRTFDKNVKILRELQKNLDGKAALGYINDKTKRLPNPGGNPPLRTVEHASKTYDVYESREREFAGRGKFMIKI